jgi:hypothetical protein
MVETANAKRNVGTSLPPAGPFENCSKNNDFHMLETESNYTSKPRTFISRYGNNK